MEYVATQSTSTYRSWRTHWIRHSLGKRK